MKSKLFVVIIFVLASLSCTKKNDIPELKSLDVPEELQGTWQWNYDYGGIFLTYYTPQTVGVTIKIQIDSDHTYRYFENNALLTQCKFILKIGESITNNDSALIISNIPGAPKSILFKNLDSLVFIDQYHNGWEHHYSRIK